MNLTSNERTKNLDEHFRKFEEKLRKEMKVNSFDEFGMPTTDNCRIVGRICNASDEKLSENKVMILNTLENESGIKRLHLNLKSVPTFSIFEGQILMFEGFNDQNYQFSVNRIHYPPPMKITKHEVSKLQDNSYNQKSMIVAAGPFTTSESLSFQPLRELMEVVKRE